MKITNNIGYLLKDLRDNGYHMTAFSFKYKEIEYDVLFEDNGNIDERKNRYAIVVLTFIDTNNPSRKYTLWCNQNRLIFNNTREFRDFFGIEYTTNLGDIFKQFYNYFVSFVPNKIPITNKRQNMEIDRHLASRDGKRDPNAIYCYDVRRLGKRNNKQSHRSIFISNLTKRRKPKLFEMLKNDSTITFYYSPNENDELTDEELINKFRKNEEKRREEGLK